MSINEEKEEICLFVGSDCIKQDVIETLIKHDEENSRIIRQIHEFVLQEMDRKKRLDDRVETFIKGGIGASALLLFNFLVWIGHFVMQSINDNFQK